MAPPSPPTTIPWPGASWPATGSPLLLSECSMRFGFWGDALEEASKQANVLYSQALRGQRLGIRCCFLHVLGVLASGAMRWKRPLSKRTYFTCRRPLASWTALGALLAALFCLLGPCSGEAEKHSKVFPGGPEMKQARPVKSPRGGKTEHWFLNPF